MAVARGLVGLHYGRVNGRSSTFYFWFSIFFFWCLSFLLSCFVAVNEKTSRDRKRSIWRRKTGGKKKGGTNHQPPQRLVSVVHYGSFLFRNQKAKKIFFFLNFSFLIVKQKENRSRPNGGNEFHLCSADCFFLCVLPFLPLFLKKKLGKTRYNMGLDRQHPETMHPFQSRNW